MVLGIRNTLYHFFDNITDSDTKWVFRRPQWHLTDIENRRSQKSWPWRHTLSKEVAYHKIQNFTRQNSNISHLIKFIRTFLDIRLERRLALGGSPRWRHYASTYIEVTSVVIEGEDQRRRQVDLAVTLDRDVTIVGVKVGHHTLFIEVLLKRYYIHWRKTFFQTLRIYFTVNTVKIMKFYALDASDILNLSDVYA